MAEATEQPRTAPAQDLSGVAADLYANSFAVSSPTQLLSKRGRGTELTVSSGQASDPRSVHSLLTNRLKRAEQFNEDLAEYFRQRNLIEDNYVKSLLRLARKPISTVGSGPGALPGEELGDVAGKIQELLERELNEVATSHTVFQRRMLQEVEAPLKSAATTGAWAKTKTYDTNLLSTIKDLEEAEARHAKSKAKVDSAGGSKKLGQLQQKAGEDSRHLNIVRDTYLTESPFALQHFQTVDQERLAFLNEAAARFETIQSDHARELMEIAEKGPFSSSPSECQCTEPGDAGMLQVLASDPREEIQEFAVKYGNPNAALGLSSGTRRARGGSRTNGVSSTRVPDSERMPPPPVPTITTPTTGAAPPIRRQACPCQPLTMLPES